MQLPPTGKLRSKARRLRAFEVGHSSGRLMIAGVSLVVQPPAHNSDTHTQLSRDSFSARKRKLQREYE